MRGLAFGASPHPHRQGGSVEHAVYDTGRNFLVCELRGGNPVRGLLVDRDWGDLSDDIATFSDDRARLGALRLGTMQAAQVAARSRFVARLRDGAVVEQMAGAEDDPAWRRYAGL